jgi:hypothetical protein
MHYFYDMINTICEWNYLIFSVNYVLIRYIYWWNILHLENINRSYYHTINQQKPKYVIQLIAYLWIVRNCMIHIGEKCHVIL